MLTGSLNQTAVLWKKTGVDGYGKATYSAGAEVALRWSDTNVLFVNQAGKQEVSRSMIHSLVQIDLDDYLYLGTLSGLSSSQISNPKLVDHAYPVKSSSYIPDLSNIEYVRKALL